MFNDYVWKTYLDGIGKEVVDFFEENISNAFSKEYTDKICELHRAYCPSKNINIRLKNQLLNLFNDINEEISFFVSGKYTFKSAIKYIYKIFKREIGDSKKEIFECFSECLEYYSTLFAIELPELFIPYYFIYNFNILEKISQEFNIDIPEIPIKKDYEGRFFYYGKICETFYDFRIEHNMTPYELCAFLYDFAPKYVGGVDSYIIEDLPDPKSAYFIGGSKDDAFLSSEMGTITCWQCNPDTMPGDMIVMYLRSPVSAVDSVWRSVSVGFNDPFFYYYRCTYIAKPCKIKQVSQKQLQKDSVFKGLPIVKKNMQGINGVELYPSFYNHLLDIAQSDLPKLTFTISNDNLALSREKDVENKLVKPFLKELGYSENEYNQQLRIEVGNHNHTEIPDFVIHPVVSKGHQSADFLIEAKLSISSIKLPEEAKTQARGYAKLLNAKYSVIASKEGVWITCVSDDYTADIMSFSWVELQSEDNFYKIFNLLGNGKI